MNESMRSLAFTRSFGPKMTGGIGMVLAACGNAGANEAPVPSPASSPIDGGVGAVQDAGFLDGSPVAALDASAPALAPTVTTHVITTTHRAIPGVMFGGWGPHLGHLVRRPNGELWFVDDACDAKGASVCDVNVNRRLDAFRLTATGWEKRASVALPAGVQQNTGTIVTADGFAMYGIDTVASRPVECTLVPTTLASSCTTVPIALPKSTNYVGAAIAPSGTKMVWATTVAEGGGSFHWMANYGGGWNGPRSGPVGGYNDASYINVAFYGGARKNEVALHAQLVSGLAPNWSFFGAVGSVDTTTSDPVSFAVLAAAPVADPIESTNDVLVDETTNDTHVLARTKSGAAAYFFRPDGGAWSAALAVIPASYRARLVHLADGRIVLVRSRNGAGLALRISAPMTRSAGHPIDWPLLPDLPVALPAGYANLYAIYTESASYARTAPPTLDVALVADAHENEVLHVHFELH